jgi:NAD(P)-dependent dehydrogenase (short-subunit alcohol dehydrogenase family)
MITPIAQAFLPENYAPAPDVLAGRTVLLTGAGSGLGQTLALELARCGATVILLGKTIANLEQTYDKIMAQQSPEPAIYPLNLETAKPGDFDDLAASIEQNLGKLDAVLHNAALLHLRSPLASYPTDAWFRMIQVNLNAAFMLSKACLPLLEQSSAGRLVFTADRQSREHHAFWGAYGVCKSALETLTQMFAEEKSEASALRINAIDPGPRDTPARRRLFPAALPSNAEKNPGLIPYLYLLSAEPSLPNGRLFLC